MNSNALFKLGYGLYLLTAREGSFDNGCIINTVFQVTSEPIQIAITVNKGNKTHDMIAATGRLNLSVLTKEAPFDLFRHFGFQSGTQVDKITGYPDLTRSENGLVYLTRYANAFLSGQVVSRMDLGTHTLFIARLTDGEVLSDQPSVTYNYYHTDIKPQPSKEAPKAKGWRCRVCGYVYEGEELPADFVCPWCKHGAEDFEPIQ